jgi:hypothetical protein
LRRRHPHATDEQIRGMLREWRRLAADLDSHRREWAVVGGFAVSARAEPRFTSDIDAAVLVRDDADSEDLVRSLLAQRYRLLASVEQDQTGRLATVRLACPVGDGDVVVVDLLFASSGIEQEIIQAADYDEGRPSLSIHRFRPLAGFYQCPRSEFFRQTIS